MTLVRQDDVLDKFKEYVNSNYGELDLTRDRAIMELIDALQSVPGYETQADWISVEDRLPEKSGQYLCYCCNPGTSAGWHSILDYSARHKLFNAFDSQELLEFAVKDVVFWMELPEPPQMEVKP